MEDLLPDVFYTRFTLGPDARVRYKGLNFRPYPLVDGYDLRQEGGTAREELRGAEINRYIHLGIMEVDNDYHSRARQHARAERHALAAPDLPMDIRVRTQMVVAFLTGWSQGKYARSQDGVEKFYVDYDAREREIVGEQLGGTDNKIYTAKNRVKWRQFLKLCKRFEVGGRTANALVKNYRGSSLHEPKFDAEVERFVQDVIATYASRTRPSAAAVIADLEAANEARASRGMAILKLPSKRTIQRRIANMSSFWKDAGREGSDEARLAYQMSFEGPVVTRPLQRVEMDEKLFDLIALVQNLGLWESIHPDVQKRLKAGKRRLWLSVAFDYASRSVLAMRLLSGSPNSRSAVETLQMAVNSKEHVTRSVKTKSPWPQCGTPETVYTDSGTSWMSVDFQDAVLAATGNHCIPPVKHPNLRGAIERFFRTIDDRYLHLFSGRTFGNVVAKGSYDAEKVASLTFDELAYSIVRLIVDCYHNTPHTSLGNMTPLEAWKMLNGLYEVKPFQNSERAMIAFGITMTDRSIGDHGVVFAGIPYGSEALQALRLHNPDRKIDIRVNLSDLSRIWMRTDNGLDYAELPSIHPGLERVSYSRWRDVLTRIDKRDPKGRSESWRVVTETMTEMKKLGVDAMERAGVGSQVYTAAELARDERKVAKGRVFARQSVPDWGIEQRGATILGNGSNRTCDESVPTLPPTSESILGAAAPGAPLDPDRFKKARAAAAAREASASASSPSPGARSSIPRERATGKTLNSPSLSPDAGAGSDGVERKPTRTWTIKSKERDG